LTPTFVGSTLLSTPSEKSRIPSRGPAAGRGVVELHHDPGVDVADTCGASWWGILHGVAQSIHDHGCPSCGKHAISLMGYAHDLVNVQLGKPIHDREAIAEWTPYAEQLAAQLQAVHQGQRRPPRCRFDSATFATNPGAVSRFMRDLGRAHKRGDANGFVDELNSLCSTVQRRLPLTQEPHPVKISGKCAGTECSLTATAGGKTLEKEPRIKVPITAVTHEGVLRAVKRAREELADALAEQGGAPVVKPRPAAPRIRRSTDEEAETFAQLDGERVELDLDVVPLDAVIASNNPETFVLNPDYPGWLQPRDRTRAANVVQVRTMAANLDPERLIEEFHTLEGGPPVVWEEEPTEPPFARPLKYMVVSGNGRAMAIQLARLEYPEVYARYVEAVHKAGWPGHGHSAAEALMLVRVINPRGKRYPTQARVREIAELGNVAKAISTSSVEQAAIDTTKMSGEFISRLTPMDDETATLADTVQAGKNRAWVTEFLGMVPSTQLAELVGPGGSLNTTGVERAVMALTMWTFGVEDDGRRLAEFAFESLVGDARNVMQGTLRAVPRLASMSAMLHGYVADAAPETMEQAVLIQGEMDITPTIAKSILRYIKIKADSQPVEQALAQASFDDPITPIEASLIRMFESNKRSARAIGEFFNAYAARVEALPNPNQVSMLDIEATELGDAHALVDQLKREPAASTQRGMFEGDVLELSKRLTARARRYKIHAEVSTI
jgi:hypothetical protein